MRRFSCSELHQKFLTKLSAYVTLTEKKERKEILYQARQGICFFFLTVLFPPGLVNAACKAAVITAQLGLEDFRMVCTLAKNPTPS